MGKQCPEHKGKLCNGQGFCNRGYGDGHEAHLGTLRSVDGTPLTSLRPHLANHWSQSSHFGAVGGRYHGKYSGSNHMLPGNSNPFMVGEGGAFPGTCTCTWPYHNGPKGACELKMCPGSSPRVIGRNPTRTVYASDWQVCSGHGKCLHTDDWYTDARVHRHKPHRVHSQGPRAADRGLQVGSELVEDGWCDCDEGWFGSDCSKAACPIVNGTECNGQGYCDRTGVNPANGDGGRCVCEYPFFGPDCSWKHCPGASPKFSAIDAPKRPLLHSDFYECHAGTKLLRGTCNYDVGECYCFDQFYGERCEYVRCPQHNGVDCNGEGTCEVHTTAYGEGEEPKQWAGPDHWHRITEAGLSWNEEEDPTRKTFKGYGKCNCNEGHEGAACENKKCPTFNTFVCAGNGHCNQGTGLCHCNAGYFGYDCSQGNGQEVDIEAFW